MAFYEEREGANGEANNACSGVGAQQTRAAAQAPNLPPIKFFASSSFRVRVLSCYDGGPRSEQGFSSEQLATYFITPKQKERKREE